MAIFGLVTRRQHQAEIEALKAQMQKFMPQPWHLATAEAQKWDIPDPSIYYNQADLYRKLSWVLAAVQAVANDAALVPFEVKKSAANEDETAIVNHPFELLLKKPNPLDSRFEFLYATVAMKKLTGNAYWWLNRQSENEEPSELWFIPSHMMKPVPDGRLYLKGYVYDPGSGERPIALEPWEVVHFRSFNPFSRFVGLSAIESLALVAAGDLGMQAWNTKLFSENNARLPGILSFAEMIADPQWEDIKAQTREASKKRELMMLRGTGSGAVNWMQNAVSQKEMEFLAGREANKEEIWAVLAPGLSAMLDPSATEANARSGRATFNDRAVYPELVMMQEKISLQLLPAYGDNLVGEFEDIRYTDRQLELQEQEAYARTHTVAEVREKYYQDKPLGDDRDKLFPVQINSSTGDGTEPPKPPPQQPGQPMTPQTEPQQEANPAARAAIDSWRRFALRTPGRAAAFQNSAIPASMHAQISARLSGVKTTAQVKAVFAALEPAAPEDKREALVVIDALRAALA